jgi:hypothetical protein
MLARDFTPEPVSVDLSARTEMVKLTAATTEWVFDAMATVAGVNASKEQLLEVNGKANEHRVRNTVKLDTNIVGPYYFYSQLNTRVLFCWSCLVVCVCWFGDVVPEKWQSYQRVSVL